MKPPENEKPLCHQPLVTETVNAKGLWYLNHRSIAGGHLFIAIAYVRSFLRRTKVI